MQRPRVAHWRTGWALVNGLRIFWISVVLWCESGVFLWSLLDCRWPGHAETPHSPSTHILLIADPQILNDYSYPGRPKGLMALTRYIVDFNLRKSWNAVLRKLRPHVVVFLGDMMDNGRAKMADDEYARYYHRFRSIFKMHTPTPVFYIPGNHDVGLGSFLWHSSRARDRYLRHFGAFNQLFEVANHTFVLLDAPGLVDEDYRQHAGRIQEGQVTKGGAAEFLQDLSKHTLDNPVVLFSHIPLSRSHRSSCGPLREKGTIRPGVGLGYQNLLLPRTSTFILEKIRPTVIFSGDDHDYCEYVHSLADGSKVREVTVKSFSMAMGIQRPGFQLLSLSPTHTAFNASAYTLSTLADTPCLLPNQIKIYTHGYGFSAMLTVLLLFVYNYKRRRNGSSVKNWSRTDVVSARPISWDSSPTSVQREAPGSSFFLSLEVPSAEQWFHDDEESLRLHRMLPTSVDLVEERDPSGARFGSGPMSPTTRRRTQSGYNGLLGRIADTRWVSGRDRHHWYSKAIRDLCQVAWLPICIYSTISVWTFWK